MYTVSSFRILHNSFVLTAIVRPLFSALDSRLHTTVGIGPLASCCRAGRTKLSRHATLLLFAISLFSSFSPLISRLHTTLGLGPSSWLSGRLIGSFTGHHHLLSATTLIFLWKLRRYRDWTPWDRPSVTSGFDHHLSVCFYYDLSLAGHLGSDHCSQNSRKNPTSSTSSFRVTSTVGKIYSTQHTT